VNATTAVYVGAGTPEGARPPASAASTSAPTAARHHGLHKESGTGTTGWVAARRLHERPHDHRRQGRRDRRRHRLEDRRSRRQARLLRRHARHEAPASTSAFTGIDNAQVGSVYAKQADLEQLRQDMLDVAQFLNAVVDDLQSLGLTS
jgi:hypothetical protein